MNHKILYQWEAEIAKKCGSLNTWQRANVALFSQGVIYAESSQQQQIAKQVACREKIASTVKRLKRFIGNEHINLDAFFEEWTSWVVSELPAGGITLLVDETKLEERLGVMVVGLAGEGRCLPLAWRCYPANSRSGYPEEGQVEMITQLLKTVQKGITPQREVMVMADRGIGTSPALCEAVDNLGWQYLFRVQGQSKLCTEQGDFALSAMVQEGEYWKMSGKMFKKRGRITAHARVLWEQGQEQAWCLVTNAPNLSGYEYARRNWQEQSFRDLKSGGWHWSKSRITAPDRMERFLIILVLAYGWVIALGGQAVACGYARCLQRHDDGTFRRHWSLFKEGLQFFMEVIHRHSLWLALQFIPDTRLL